MSGGTGLLDSRGYHLWISWYFLRFVAPSTLVEHRISKGCSHSRVANLQILPHASQAVGFFLQDEVLQVYGKKQVY